MRTDMQQKRICGIEVELTRKPIKNFYLRVVPPDGVVRMSVPLRARKSDIVAMVDERKQWICERRSEILLREPAVPALDVVTGETAELWGAGHRLAVVETRSAPRVAVLGNQCILVTAPHGQSRDLRVRQLREFYRGELKAAADPLFERWSSRMDVEFSEWRTKKMSTRWGTCNVKERRIWLSLDLARRDPSCLESVVVHELAHLIEPKHTKRFWSIMDHHHPAWRLAEQELRHNHSPRIE